MFVRLPISFFLHLIYSIFYSFEHEINLMFNFVHFVFAGRYLLLSKHLVSEEKAIVDLEPILDIDKSIHWTNEGNSEQWLKLAVMQLNEFALSATTASAKISDNFYKQTEHVNIKKRNSTNRQTKQVRNIHKVNRSGVL